MCASPSTARPATTDTFRRWKVFADDSTELETPDRELRLDDALDLSKDAEPGGYVEEPMESVAFGRIAAQQAKQVMVQKVREAERAQVVDLFSDSHQHAGQRAWSSASTAMASSWTWATMPKGSSRAPT